MTCPCRNYKNIKWHGQDIVYDHLIYNGPSHLGINQIVEVSKVPLLDQGKNDDDMGLENNINFRDNLDEMLYRTNGPNANIKKQPS